MRVASADVYSIRPNCIVAYSTYEGFSDKLARPDMLKHDLSKEANKTKGKLSDNSIRRLRYAINLLNFVSPDVPTANVSNGKIYPFRLNFITLTLPARQAERACELFDSKSPHSDEMIKRHALNGFLNATQKKYGKYSYVWKAEVQANGNIHFHLTTNCYMDYSVLRNYWNAQLYKFGYIDKYRQAQKEWHGECFRPRPWLFATWPEKKQYKAWEFGEFTNWSSPNSTDVHAVKKVNSLAAYIVDYMCKKEGGKREILGKIWGCSKNLSYNNKFHFTNHALTSTEMNIFNDIMSANSKQFDFFTIYFWEETTLMEALPPRLMSEFEQWRKDTYNFNIKDNDNSTQQRVRFSDTRLQSELSRFRTTEPTTGPANSNNAREQLSISFDN